MDDVVGYFTPLFADRPRAHALRRLTTDQMLLSFLCDFYDFVLRSRPIRKKSIGPFSPAPLLPRTPLPPLPTP